MIDNCYYIIREKDTGIIAKGRSSGNYNSATFRETSAAPKLYSLGRAKGVVTEKKNSYDADHKKEYEIIPVFLTFGNPI